MIAERGKQRQRSRSAVPAISTEPPTCQNVRGGTRLKTIQLPGVAGAFTNFYGPSKRVLRQIWPDGTEIRFNYKVVGGCVPGLTSHTAQPTEGTPLAGGSNTQGKGDAPLCLEKGTHPFVCYTKAGAANEAVAALATSRTAEEGLKKGCVPFLLFKAESRTKRSEAGWSARCTKNSNTEHIGIGRKWNRS